MSGYLEVQSSGRRNVVPLVEGKFTVGKAPTNHLVIDSDPKISRVHLTIESYEGSWTIRDLGSTNGTFVNGKRIWGETILRTGDEIRVGNTLVHFRADEFPLTRTESETPPPRLTPREREVLITLCKPILSSDIFAQPATVEDIARLLFVTPTAVKQHLIRLYNKFGIYEGEGNRRVRLANEAIARGAIGIRDLKEIDE